MFNVNRCVFAFALVVAIASQAYGAKTPGLLPATDTAVLYDTTIAYWTSTESDTARVPALGSGSWQPFPKSMVANDVLWFGADNLFIRTNDKLCSLYVWGTGHANLEIDGAAGSVRGYTPSRTRVMVEGTVTKGSKGDTTVFVIVFDPQPDYEIFRIKATGPATIAGAKAVTKCYYEPDRVPSLTSYGLIVLLGLLILSGVYVIYNRRKGVSRA